MRLSTTHYFMFCFTLFLAGCITSRPPAWVKNPKIIYPEQNFLVALGEGDTRSASENSAAANLARIFNSTIKSEETVFENINENKHSFERNLEYTTDLNITSEQTLKNIKHAEAWTDPKTARVHAIAYINRRETATLLLGEMQENASKINFYITQSKTTTDSIRRYALFRPAVQLALKNEKILQQLRIIHPASVHSRLGGYDINSLKQSLVDAAKNIQFSTKIRGDNNRRITSTIEEIITSYGFVLGEPATLNCFGAINIAANGRHGKLDYVRYAFDLQIKDASNRTYITFNEKGREAHNTPEEAHARALRTIEKSIRTGLVKRFDAYFNRLAQQTN